VEVWELLCGHDLSDEGFWARRGFTPDEIARARDTDCPFPGIDPDEILERCGWPGSDEDPGPRHDCLAAFVSGGGVPGPTGGGAPPGAARAAGGISALMAPSPLAGIPWLYLGLGAIGLIVLIVILRRL